MQGTTSAVAAGTTQTVLPEKDLETTERSKQSTGDHEVCRSLHCGEAVKIQAQEDHMNEQEVQLVTREWRRWRRWHRTVETVKVVGLFVGFLVLTVLVSLGGL